MVTTSHQILSAEPKQVVSIEGITEYRLENGLQLLLFPDPSRPTVTVNLTIFVGSRHEGYGEAGMAHLLEHMVFKGTPTHPDVPKSLQERGARFNGTTWVDRTNYYETMPASDENLEFAIRLEADRMVNSSIKGEDLASEMTVVRNEFESGENSPRSILDQRINAAAYEWHNYGKSTIGNRSDIERVPLPKLREFYRRHYQPDNAMVVVAGQFEEEKALEYVRKYFGSIPRPERKLDRTYTEEPAQDGERTVTLRRVGNVGIVGVAYHIPAGAHPDYAAVDVLGYILATEPAGRLYKTLVETKKASSIVGGTYSWHDPGLLTMMIEVPDVEQMDDARTTMLAEIEKIGEEGVSDEEVARVRQQILSRRERSLSTTSRLAVNLSEWASQGDWRLFFLYRDRVEQVTADDVKRVAAQFMHPNNRTVGVFIPTEEAQRITIPATPDVAAILEGYQGRDLIAAGEQFDATPENIESRTTRTELASGLKVALLPKKTRGESVHLRITLRYGNADNLRGYNTATGMLPTLMTRGTIELSYQQLKDELDQQRATLSGSGSVGLATFSIETKRPQLKPVLELLRQVLREPSFPAEEFEVLRREQLARLERSKTEPQSLASNRYRRTLAPFPKDDVRYVPTVEESIGRVKAVKLEQIRELYANYLGSQCGELAVIGDFDPAEVKSLFEEILEAWPPQKPYARIHQVVFTDVVAVKETVLTPDKANAVYFGGLTVPMKDSDPQYPSLLMGNEILGGGALSSRLADRVRQRDGLSYGVGSMFQAASLDSYARLGIFAISNPDNSPKVVQAIREEIELLHKKGITDEELARAKRGYLEGQTVRLTDDSRLTSVLTGTLYARRTMEFQADLEARIDKLTNEEVVDAIRQYVDLERMIVVVAGDFGESE
jgi:zinc protease